MERNLSAWRKMAGLLIFLVLCILPCGAETSNRQRIIALDNEIYQDIDALYMMNGFAPPSYARPWSEDEIDHILSKLQRIKKIESNGGKTIVSEGIDANIQDIINYSIFALIRHNEGEV